MYSVDDRDHVVELREFPQWSAGAPMPVVLADDYNLVLSYEVELEGGLDSDRVFIRFPQVYAHYLGAPNDEAFEGHPLASRGAGANSAYLVEGSSWVRSLEKMNRVHHRHDPRRFDNLRHYLFCFHDTTFECVAPRLEIVSPPDAAASLAEQLSALLWESAV